MLGSHANPTAGLVPRTGRSPSRKHGSLLVDYEAYIPFKKRKVFGDSDLERGGLLKSIASLEQSLEVRVDVRVCRMHEPPSPCTEHLSHHLCIGGVGEHMIRLIERNKAPRVLRGLENRGRVIDGDHGIRRRMKDHQRSPELPHTVGLPVPTKRIQKLRRDVKRRTTERNLRPPFGG